MNKHITPSPQHLSSAFNRARLAGLGYTLESALQQPALKLSLYRLAQVVATPPRPSHFRGAIDD